MLTSLPACQKNKLDRISLGDHSHDKLALICYMASSFDFMQSIVKTFLNVQCMLRWDKSNDKLLLVLFK